MATVHTVHHKTAMTELSGRKFGSFAALKQSIDAKSADITERKQSEALKPRSNRAKKWGKA